MTLKGGMLMAAMSARRMTKDADLSTVGVGNDEGVVAAAVAEIVGTELDVDDGLASMPTASERRSCARTPSITGCG